MPGAARALRGRALIAVLAGDAASARERLRDAANFDPYGGGPGVQAAYLESELLELRLYRELLDVEAIVPNAYPSKLAVANFGLRRYKEALEQATKFLSFKSDGRPDASRAECMYIAAVSLKNLGRQDEATALRAKLLKTWPAYGLMLTEVDDR